MKLAQIFNMLSKCFVYEYITFLKAALKKKSSFDICSLNLNVKMLIKCVYFRGPDSYWSMPCAVNCHWTLWETRRKTYFGLYCLNSYFCSICLYFQLLTYMYQIELYAYTHYISWLSTILYFCKVCYFKFLPNFIVNYVIV